MGVFAFHDAYPETTDVSEDESDGEQADFYIDSDASDADLPELKQEPERIGPGEGSTRPGRCHSCSSRDDATKMETVCLNLCALPAALRHIDR